MRYRWIPLIILGSGSLCGAQANTAPSPHHFWVSADADLSISPAMLKASGTALEAIRAVVWTAHGVAGRDFALHAIGPTEASADSSEGDAILSMALSDFFAAKIDNANLLTDAALNVVPKKYRTGDPEADYDLARQLLANDPTMAEVERREGLCATAIRDILSAGVAPVKVADCEEADLDPPAGRWPFETEREPAKTPPASDSFAIGPRCTDAVNYALDSVDLVFAAFAEGAGGGIAEERIDEANGLCIDAGERIVAGALDGYGALKNGGDGSRVERRPG